VLGHHTRFNSHVFFNAQCLTQQNDRANLVKGAGIQLVGSSILQAGLFAPLAKHATTVAVPAAIRVRDLSQREKMLLLLLVLVLVLVLLMRAHAKEEPIAGNYLVPFSTRMAGQHAQTVLPAHYSIVMTEITLHRGRNGAGSPKNATEYHAAIFTQRADLIAAMILKAAWISAVPSCILRYAHAHVHMVKNAECTLASVYIPQKDAHCAARIAWNLLVPNCTQGLTSNHARKAFNV